MATRLSTPVKIAVVGPECCGKTTLAQDLANHRDYQLIPEYARLYFAQKTTPGYDIDDIVAIAKGQLAQEQSSPATILVCDTTLLVCKIWAEVRFGYCPQWILAHYNPHAYIAHFLTAPDIPWEADPLRENPLDRDWLFSLYEADLQKSGANYHILRGDRIARLQRAGTVLSELG